MKEYYEGVEFSKLEPEVEATVPVDTDDAVAGLNITKFMTEVRRMVTAVGTGQSTMTRGAIQLKGAPIMRAIAQLEDTPSMEALLHFLDMAQQDVNRRFRAECELIFCENEKVKKALNAVRVAELQREADEEEAAQKRALKELETRNG